MEVVGRQNKVGSFQRRTLQSCYKNRLMLGLTWGVFIWVRSFIRLVMTWDLALRQQLMVLKRQTKRVLLRPNLVAVGESSSNREARHSRSMAPERLPSVRALSFPTQKCWQTDDRARDSDFPPHHGKREPDLGNSPHTRRILRLGFEISERTVSRCLSRLHRCDGAAPTPKSV
jgi:hypothetical protein